MSQSYGKTHGWAYNANKWFISIIWASGSPTINTLFEILKVFHDLKPNRSSDNTKNPTVTSNSWGQSTFFFSTWSAHFRTPGDGTAGTGSLDTISVSGTNVSPEWINYFWGNTAYSKWYATTHANVVEGASMLDAGVIWLGSAGNNNQKHVKGDHPDYNNYFSSMNLPGGGSGTLTEAELYLSLIHI